MKKDQFVRVRFIDAMLSQHGMFSRKMLVDVFGISEITATRDIREYNLLGARMYYCSHYKVFKTCTDYKECPELWNCDATASQFLKGIEAVYDVKIGVQPVPTFGVHKA